MNVPFSKRHSYRKTAPITIREEAPAEVREALLVIAKEEGFSPSYLRSTVCQVLRKVPDPNNWTEYPNVWDEVQGLVASCLWYKVYDIAEEIYKDIASLYERRRLQATPESFESKLNEFFEEHGVGWRMTEGQIQYRGGEGFERAVEQASAALAEAGRMTAETEIREALRDLSRRPEPDRTGAIQHAMAALECLARDLCGEKGTLGELLKRYKERLGIPEPLHTAVEKAWGFASERGRHLLERREPTAPEAELILSLCAALVTFLSAKKPSV